MKLEQRLRHMLENFETYPPKATLEMLLEALHDDCTEVMSEIAQLDEPVEEACCGQFDTCTEPCTPRADYWKNNSRTKVNKLALSILKESLRDEGYRLSWINNLSMAMYDSLSQSNYLSQSKYRGYGSPTDFNAGAELFLKNLFGGLND